MKVSKTLAVLTLSTVTMLSGCASTTGQSVSNGIGKVLNTTGSILNAVTGVTATGSALPNTKGNLIQIQGKETNEYKFQNMSIDVGQLGVNSPAAYLTGEFHNKTNKTLHFTINIPVYDSKGFSVADIYYSGSANAHEKVRISDLHNFTESDQKPDVSKVSYFVKSY